jgi:hypothetical protein
MLGEDHDLDGLAAGMADGTVSRGRALKLAGAALLGSALSLFSAQREADANHLARQRRRCRRRGGTFCYGPHRGGVCCGPNRCPSPGQCAKGRCGRYCPPPDDGPDDGPD